MISDTFLMTTVTWNEFLIEPHFMYFHVISFTLILTCIRSTKQKWALVLFVFEHICSGSIYKRFIKILPYWVESFVFFNSLIIIKCYRRRSNLSWTLACVKFCIMFVTMYLTLFITRMFYEASSSLDKVCLRRMKFILFHE